MVEERAKWRLGKEVRINRETDSLAPFFWGLWSVTVFPAAAAKIAKEYEKQGGDYENEPGSKNKAKKGAPESKSKDGMFQLSFHCLLHHLHLALHTL